MGKLFYKTCRHGNCGSNVMFHNKHERGYGTDLNNLETYTKEQAQKEMDYQDGSLLLLKSEVDKLATKHVDMQYLDMNKGSPTSLDDECVIQVDGEYNGNDIQFHAETGSTFDLFKAKVISLRLALAHSHCNSTVWLKSYLESISRNTFQSFNINKRRMIVAGGIKYRTQRKLNPTGKRRGNCPICGKITWDYDPYNDASCKDHNGYRKGV